MITGKDEFHKELAIASIESFKRQTYPNKKLIIINDGGYSLNSYLDKRMTECRLYKKHKLGTLRNYALLLVPKNALWIQWDDDDYHHPLAMEAQYNILKEKGVDLVLLKNQVRYYFPKNHGHIASCKNGHAGTPLARKKTVTYPQTAKGEDYFFFKQFARNYSTYVWDNPAHLYLRFYHGHNTWGAGHFSLSSREENTWLLPEKEQEFLSEVLQEHYFFLLNDSFSVPSQDSDNT